MKGHGRCVLWKCESFRCSALTRSLPVATGLSFSCQCVQGGKAAAQTILDMWATGDYSKASTQAYEKRWIAAFGHDFAMVLTFTWLRSACLCPSVPPSVLLNLLHQSGQVDVHYLV